MVKATRYLRDFVFAFFFQSYFSIRAYQGHFQILRYKLCKTLPFASSFSQGKQCPQYMQLIKGIEGCQFTVFVSLLYGLFELSLC